MVRSLWIPDKAIVKCSNSITYHESSSYDLRYLLGLLNSRLSQWRFKLTSSNNNVGTNELLTMPFRIIRFGERDEKLRHDRMVELVESILTLHRQLLAAAKTAHERTAIERQIEATDHQIDKLVYDLYGLTEKEITIVESATTSRSTAAE